MEKRKQEEIEFHNRIRDLSLAENSDMYDFYRSNSKFYAVTQKSNDYLHSLIMQKQGKVLDYCCGDGGTSISLAKRGMDVTGIDISDVSIANCKRVAISEGVAEKASFFVMDAEKTEFADNSFDIITCVGVLHHLDVNLAFPELARLLKPGGIVIAQEALAYNPLIQWYRSRTPHLRTEWEKDHILGFEELDIARISFGQVDAEFFHLAALAAVPFRDTRLFKPLLRALEVVDDVLLSWPIIQRLAWQMIFTCSKPVKSSMSSAQ